MSSAQKVLAVVGFVVVVGAVAAVTLFATRDQNTTPSTANENPSANSSASENQSENSGSGASQFSDFLGPANVRGTVDMQGQQEVSVDIGDYYYDATVLTVSQGTTVTWTNQGNIQHNVVTDESSPDGGELNSELLGNGEAYSYTFDEPGTYYYFCEPHPTSMRGVVIVK